MQVLNVSHLSSSSVYLINDQEVENAIVGVDPEDLIIHPDLDKLTEAHHWKWIDDALGVVPHCLQLLKGCHTISEKLVATAMASSNQEKFVELAAVSPPPCLATNQEFKLILQLTGSPGDPAAG